MISKELLDSLLKEVRNYSDITWTDSAGDEKLSGMIIRGLNYFEHLLGRTISFAENEDQGIKELLFIRIMYERSGALDDFRKNYASEILSLVNDEKVKSYVEEETRD